jgi:hypothetical protein
LPSDETGSGQDGGGLHPPTEAEADVSPLCDGGGPTRNKPKCSRPQVGSLASQGPYEEESGGEYLTSRAGATSAADREAQDGQREEQGQDRGRGQSGLRRPKSEKPSLGPHTESVRRDLRRKERGQSAGQSGFSRQSRP